jgi:hypothetical protein
MSVPPGDAAAPGAQPRVWRGSPGPDPAPRRQEVTELPVVRRTIPRVPGARTPLRRVRGRDAGTPVAGDPSGGLRAAAGRDGGPRHGGLPAEQADDGQAPDRSRQGQADGGERDGVRASGQDRAATAPPAGRGAAAAGGSQGLRDPQCGGAPRHRAPADGRRHPQGRAADHRRRRPAPCVAARHGAAVRRVSSDPLACGRASSSEPERLHPRGAVFGELGGGPLVA